MLACREILVVFVIGIRFLDFFVLLVHVHCLSFVHLRKLEGMVITLPQKKYINSIFSFLILLVMSYCIIGLIFLDMELGSPAADWNTMTSTVSSVDLMMLNLVKKIVILIPHIMFLCCKENVSL